MQSSQRDGSIPSIPLATFFFFRRRRRVSGMVKGWLRAGGGVVSKRVQSELDRVDGVGERVD